MATLLLECGIGIRAVQELVGHNNVSTTARHTHLAVGWPQRVYAAAHLAERGATGVVAEFGRTRTSGP